MLLIAISLMVEPGSRTDNSIKIDTTRIAVVAVTGIGRGAPPFLFGRFVAKIGYVKN